MDPMEPVQPTPLDAQATTVTPNAPASSGGRFSRVGEGLKGVLGLKTPPEAGSSNMKLSTPSLGEPSQVPGLQPRPDTTPAAVVPSPWANPEIAATAIPTATAAPDAAAISDPIPVITPEPAPIAPVIPDYSDPTVTTNPTNPADQLTAVQAPGDSEPVSAATPEPTATMNPLASVAVEPTPPPIPESIAGSVVDSTVTQTEPVVAATPELTIAPTPEPIAVSPVWEQDTTPAAEPADKDSAVADATTIDPDMRPSSAPSVELTTTEAPVMFRKIPEGDKIRIEVTPEGRERMKAVLVEAIESGALDGLAEIFGPQEATPASSQPLETSTESQPVTPQGELPPPVSPLTPPTPDGTI